MGTVSEESSSTAGKSNVYRSQWIAAELKLEACYKGSHGL